MNGWDAIKARMIIAVLAAPILGLFIFSVVAARRARPMFTNAGELLIRYSLPLRIFGIFAGIIMPLLVCLLLIVFIPEDWSELYMALGSVLFFLLLGGWSLFETHFVRLTVSQQGITYHSPWRRECIFAWDEIAEITTFSYTYPFVFHGRDGRKFTISSFMTNVPLLVEVFCIHLDPAVYERARRGMSWTPAHASAGKT